MGAVRGNNHEAQGRARGREEERTFGGNGSRPTRLGAALPIDYRKRVTTCESVSLQGQELQVQQFCVPVEFGNSLIVSDGAGKGSPA